MFFFSYGDKSAFLGAVYGETSSRVEGLPTYTGRANFSYISFQNVESRLHEKKISPLRLHVHSSPYTLRSTTDQTDQTNQTNPTMSQVVA